MITYYPGYTTYYYLPTTIGWQGGGFAIGTLILVTYICAGR